MAGMIQRELVEMIRQQPGGQVQTAQLAPSLKIPHAAYRRAEALCSELTALELSHREILKDRPL